MDKAKAKLRGRKRRQARVRGKVYGTAQRPRLSVYRSNTGVYAQLIDDNAGQTLASASTVDKEVKGTFAGLNGREVAAKIGELLASRASKAGIVTVVFDRGGRLFHGRVKSLADAARAGGLKF